MLAYTQPAPCMAPAAHSALSLFLYTRSSASSLLTGPTNVQLVGAGCRRAQNGGGGRVLQRRGAGAACGPHAQGGMAAPDSRHGRGPRPLQLAGPRCVVAWWRGGVVACWCAVRATVPCPLSREGARRARPCNKNTTLVISHPPSSTHPFDVLGSHSSAARHTMPRATAAGCPNIALLGPAFVALSRPFSAGLSFMHAPRTTAVLQAS